MKRLTATLLLAAALPASAAEPSGEWQLLPRLSDNQQFTDGEFPRDPAPGGLALVVVDGGWHLMPARLQSREGPDQAAFTVDAEPAGALAWLRLPGLVAGKVDTPDVHFMGAQRDLRDGTIALPFKGKPWRFETRGSAIWFTDGNRRQKIDDLAALNDPAYPVGFGLAWAGDLDRDGSLDFVTTLVGDDGLTTCVWLSSRAAAGELVGQAVCVDRLF